MDQSFPKYFGLSFDTDKLDNLGDKTDRDCPEAAQKARVGHTPAGCGACQVIVQLTNPPVLPVLVTPSAAHILAASVPHGSKLALHWR